MIGFFLSTAFQFFYINLTKPHEQLCKLRPDKSTIPHSNVKSATHSTNNARFWEAEESQESHQKERVKKRKPPQPFLSCGGFALFSIPIRDKVGAQTSQSQTSVSGSFNPLTGKVGLKLVRKPHQIDARFQFPDG